MTSWQLLAAILLAGLLLACGLHIRLRRQYKNLTSDLERCMRDACGDRMSLTRVTKYSEHRDQFVSTVSHELRTPLTSIRAALGLLSSGSVGVVDEPAARLLRIASNNTDRLVRLLNNVLDLERMDSGTDTPFLQSCNLRELLEEAVGTMLPMAGAAGVTINLQKAQDTCDSMAALDRDRIVQVICNLLSNAIKYAPRVSAIDVTCRVESSIIEVRVCDRGRGVPLEKLESIFDRFSQVEPADSRLKGGTGLGLAICRAIVIQHGGTIHAENNTLDPVDQRGASFVLRLPVGL